VRRVGGALQYGWLYGSVLVSKDRESAAEDEGDRGIDANDRRSDFSFSDVQQLAVVWQQEGRLIVN